MMLVLHNIFYDYYTVDLTNRVMFTEAQHKTKTILSHARFFSTIQKICTCQAVHGNTHTTIGNWNL